MFSNITIKILSSNSATYSLQYNLVKICKVCFQGDSQHVFLSSLFHRMKLDEPVFVSRCLYVCLSVRVLPVFLVRCSCTAYTALHWKFPLVSSISSYLQFLISKFFIWNFLDSIKDFIRDEWSETLSEVKWRWGNCTQSNIL